MRSSSRFIPRRAAGIALTIAAAATLMVANAAPAAATVRNVGLLNLAETTIGATPNAPTATVVDRAGRTAFVTDFSGNSIRVFDVSGEKFVPTATIGGILKPYRLALDDDRHRLYVGSAQTPESLVTIDLEPGSPTYLNPVRSIPTQGSALEDIAVDVQSNVVFAANALSDTVTRFNMNDNSVSLIPASFPVDVEVDPVSHAAFISSAGGRRVIRIDPDGSSASVAVPGGPKGLDVGNGVVFVTAGQDANAKVLSFDSTTLSPIAESPKLGGNPVDLVVDAGQHLVYVTLDVYASTGFVVLRTDSLSMEGVIDTGAHLLKGLSIDSSSHDLYAAEFTTSTPSRLFMYHSDPAPESEVDRLGGADRFVVSATVADDTFDTTVPVVYVASGGVFADALSGSTAAGLGGGPVMLVSRDVISPEVRNRLSELRPQRIVILGGAASIGEAVESQLRRYSVVVERIGGADRYEVSAAVSKATFPTGASVVYLASGEVFPDALSGSAAAGRDRGPVLLVQHDGIPPAVATELTRLNPQRIVVLGGVNTVAESVVTQLAITHAVTRVDGADRFAVSAAVSARAYPRGAYVAYVASGSVFPDALAGSAAAITNGGPVLLVSRDGIPAVVSAELERLKPYRIVVLGGTNTVSDAVLDQLRQFLSA